LAKSWLPPFLHALWTIATLATHKSF
jgi:hypothetical protein